LKRIESSKELVSLRGAFLHKIGDQNRISLPANFKEAVCNRGVKRLVVVKYQDCLRAWPEDEWDKRESGFSSLNLDDDKVSEYLRYLYANCADFEVDTQGRIFLPENWKKELAIKDQVFLVGMGNLFELWNPERYQYKQEELKNQFSLNRAYVAELLEKRKRDEGN
jgi:MraZ protein